MSHYSSSDISLIPLDDIPFQKHLDFQPCPTPLAVSFLQVACLAENRALPREQLKSIYEKTYTLISNDEPDAPCLPFPSQAPPCPDLRRAINQLQFWTSGVAEGGVDADVAWDDAMTGLCDERTVDWSFGSGEATGSSSTAEDGSAAATYDIYRIGKHAEYSSYVDAYLERRPSDMLEACAIDRYGPSTDDEVSLALLEKPPSHTTGLVLYNKDGQIAHDILSLSRDVLESSGAGARSRSQLSGERGDTRHFNFRSLMEARVANQLRAVSFLDDVISLYGPLLPRGEAILDYTPYVRRMILADDVMEIGAQQVSEGDVDQRRGRRSRWRGEYVRHLSVSSEGQAGARNLAFSE